MNPEFIKWLKKQTFNSYYKEGRFKCWFIINKSYNIKYYENWAEVLKYTKYAYRYKLQKLDT